MNRLEFDELIQWSSDTIRLLRIGLTNHDPLTIEMANERIISRMGEDFADKVLFNMITSMMEEGWSFFDEDGNPSPLL